MVSTSFTARRINADHWMDVNRLGLRDIDVTLVDRFVQSHLSTCNCNLKLHGSVGESKAALRHLLKFLPSTSTEQACPTNTITAELDLFADYLRNICGVKPGTAAYFCRDVRALLSYCFKDGPIEPHHLRTPQIDAFLRSAGLHMRTSSVQVVCTSLRSYFRFHSLKGDATETLSASLPQFPHRNQQLPKTLSETHLVAFLKAFDLSNPVELRDYAIARCLLDLTQVGAGLHLAQATSDLLRQIAADVLTGLADHVKPGHSQGKGD